ncbi:MAG TPA: hypothetical protein VK612_06290, partial [Pyrinomonadaceae bacterium]|nr:hypothetical protein [Pyrinomonadaceae bacterium]
MYKPTQTLIFTAFFVFGLFSFASSTAAQPPPPKFFNERFIMKQMPQIHAVQVTYQATSGAGKFGSLAQLRQAGLIDEALASGLKYLYRFNVTVTPATTTTPPKYVATATPMLYRKGGLRSYFIDENGDVRGGDKNGGLATVADPVIDTCALWGIADNERCTLLDVRNLHGAEMTYAATYGNGNFGSVAQLIASRFISERLSTGQTRGYNFTVTFANATGQNPATFQISAVPQIYGVTGIRSFFIATDGVIRGGDKNGAPVDENDPEIDQCLGLGISCYESVSVSSLRTLHGAEMTFAATSG